MKKFLISTVILTLLYPAHARLGETLEQCLKRYGEPTKTKLDDQLEGVATYNKNDLVISIHFTNGKADLIRYSPGHISSVDLDLAKYLLQLNGRNKEWDQLTETKIILQEIQDKNMQYPRTELIDPILWKSKDGLLEASYSVSKGTFETRAATFQEKIREGL